MDRKLTGRSSCESDLHPNGSDVCPSLPRSGLSLREKGLKTSRDYDLGNQKYAKKHVSDSDDLSIYLTFYYFERGVMTL